MGKSTLVLVTLAALGLGALIGSSLLDEETEEIAAEAAPTTAAPTTAAPTTGASTTGASTTGASTTGASTTAAPTAVMDLGGAPAYRFLSPDSVTVEKDEYGQALPVANGENFIARDGEIKTETVTVALELDAVTEYKAVMKQGDSIVFRWSTDGGQAYYDFHAHDAAFGEGFFTRYAEGEGTSNAGSIVAAYNGQHGWYWMNISDGPLTITLEVSGFYDEIIEIDLEGY